MTAPLISVCVPVYNNSDTLARTVEALLAQTYRPLEVVLSDNGSTDGSREIAESARPLVRFHRLEHTVSQNESWRYALRLGRGELVRLHAADDHTLAPDFLERMAAPLLADPALDFTVCAANIVPAPGFDADAAALMARVHDAISAHVRDVLASPGRRERAAKLLRLSLENRVGTPYSALVRRRALPRRHWRKLSSYWPESYADWDFMLRLLLDRRGAWVNGARYDYHLTEGMGFWKIVRGLDSRVALHDRMYRLLMPITVLCDPDLAALRDAAGVHGQAQLAQVAAQRLAEAAAQAARVPNDFSDIAGVSA